MEIAYLHSIAIDLDCHFFRKWTGSSVEVSTESFSNRSCHFILLILPIESSVRSYRSSNKHGLDGGVRLWLTDLGRCVVNYRSFSTPAWCVRFSPKNRCFCVCSEGGIVYMYNTDDIQYARRFVASLMDIYVCEWSVVSMGAIILGTASGDTYLCNAE